MRNSTILTTLAVAVVAAGLAYAFSQSEKTRNFLQNSSGETASDVTETAMTTQTAPATSDTAPVVAATETPAAVTPQATETASATPPETAQATGGMTPVNLDNAAALNDQATAAGTNADTAEPTTAEPAQNTAPAGKFTVDVAAALEDRSLGSPDAPITVEDYSSLSCPHCAMFHNTVLPQIKNNYIDTGKVRWIFRSFPLNDPALKAEMITRCAPKEQYVKLQDLIYENQQRWAFTEDPLPNLNMLLRLAGITDEMFLACSNNKELETAMAKKLQAAGDKFEINSTPTFILNGDAKHKIEGAGSYTGFAFDLDQILKAKGLIKEEVLKPNL